MRQETREFTKSSLTGLGSKRYILLPTASGRIRGDEEASLIEIVVATLSARILSGGIAEAGRDSGFVIVDPQFPEKANTGGLQCVDQIVNGLPG